MDGILVINKPLGVSSHDCVNTLRKIFSTKKIGHSGTLDVDASGVLVLGINKGTKILNYLHQDIKAYEFSVCFGVETDTLDHTGAILRSEDVSKLPDLENVLNEFMGVYLQKPPAYSAVKHQGKKLYEYARSNQPIPDIPAKERTVYALRRVSEMRPHDRFLEADFYVKCSKGLYVRQLALDLAKKMHTVAHTTRIHRVLAGDFTIDQAIKLTDVSATTKLISLSDALQSLPEIIVDKDAINRIKHGQPIAFSDQGSLLKVLDENRNLLAIYQHTGTTYTAKNVFL